MTTWSNWSGSVQCEPQQIRYPKTIEEVVEMVKQARTEGRKIRLVGSGHSFTPLVETNDWILSLDEMQGVIEVDEVTQVATIWAGTKLGRLGQELSERGWGQENLGDIDVQSIAGAVSTGTHGTGITLGNIPSQVVGLTLVTGTGDVVECSADNNPDLFKAAQVSLGALGIIVQMKLKVEPKYRLHYRSNRMDLDECLANLNTMRAENRHFEFFCFPYSNQVQAKWMNKTEREPAGNRAWSYFSKMVLENGVFWCLSELSRIFPRFSSSVSRFSASAVPSVEEVDESYRLFATPRLVRFVEMEYSLPAEHMATVIKEIQYCINQHQFAVHFPIECRYVKGDDIWLSPVHGRDSAYIAVHMYKGMPHESYFTALEEIFRRYEGRPHWGKMHAQTAETLKTLYPKWENFLEIRKQMDPEGVFLTPYLSKLFGK